MEKKFTLLILKQATKSTHKLKVIIVSFLTALTFVTILNSIDLMFLQGVLDFKLIKHEDRRPSHELFGK